MGWSQHSCSQGSSRQCALLALCCLSAALGTQDPAFLNIPKGSTWIPGYPPGLWSGSRGLIPEGSKPLHSDGTVRQELHKNDALWAIEQLSGSSMWSGPKGPAYGGEERRELIQLVPTNLHQKCVIGLVMNDSCARHQPVHKAGTGHVTHRPGI